MFEAGFLFKKTNLERKMERLWNKIYSKYRKSDFRLFVEKHPRLHGFLSLLYRYRHAQVLWIGIIYPIWFKSLESRITVNTGYHIMHTEMDNLIPFCEIFIVPYFLWFIYIFAGLLYFMLVNKEDFYKISLFLFMGMIASLIICEIYPNGTDFRPAYLSEKNIFMLMVKRLYRIDTPTNVFPSIHAYNSLCMHIALMKSKELRAEKYGRAVRSFSCFLCIFICIATLVLKQHSVLDVGGAILLCFITYGFVYGYPSFALGEYWERLTELRDKKD